MPGDTEIIFVAHDIGGSGGMERHAEQLIERLLQAGHRVTVVARTCRLPAHPGLRVRRVAVPRRPFAVSYPAFFLIASAMLARRPGAILHTTGAVVGNRAQISTVHYCHRASAQHIGGSRASRPGPLFGVNATISRVLSEAAEAWCYRPGRTRLLCAVSEGVADELRSGFPAMAARVRSIPNGVDSSVFRPDPNSRRFIRDELGLPEDTFVALFAGGDWERKGLSFAVDALRDAPNWHLVVAGPGDSTPQVMRADEALTGGRVHFLGRVSDMPRLYAACDAFVFPTTYEAFPLVVLEAAAAGLPLLVTRVNGVTEILRDGENGWFIRRDGADIAERLRALSDDRELARSLGRAARQAVAGHSWQAMADAYMSLYDELESLPAERSAATTSR